jgi:hypothetical protein
MTTYVTMDLMNSILTAGKTCDDTMAILERLNNTEGLQVVANDDPRATDIAVCFMYPSGARAGYMKAQKGS